MDPKILIPENEENHDIASVVYEGFQMNGHQMLPINVIENFYKNNLENTFMKGSYKVLEQQRISHLDVNKVEKEMMTNQAIHFIEKGFLKDNIDKIKLKQKTLYRDVSDAAKDSYDLIQRKHLLRNTVEQSVDFRYNFNKLHNCSKCKSVVNLVQYDQTAMKKSANEKLDKVSINVTESLQSEEKYPSVFNFEPPQIIFYNYDVNLTYQGTVKLRNISKRIRCFYFDELPASSRYKVILKTLQSKLAPGMATEFIVTFETPIYQDHCDRFFIRCRGFKDVCLKLVCYRDPPILGCYLFRDMNKIMEKPKFCDKGFSLYRRKAINNSIDCGSVWLGESRFISLVFKNKQQSGVFFLMTHDEWYTQTIFTINTCYELEIPGFKIFPAYFQMTQEGLLEMYILFTPQYYGLHTEELFFICNNNCFERIEIIGDGYYFGRELFQISLIDHYFQEPNTSLYKTIVEDMEDLTVYLGTSNRKTMYDFIVKIYNRSPFDLRYYWIIKKDSDACPCCEPMDIECVNIKCEPDVLVHQDITTFEMSLTTTKLKEDYNNIMLCLFVKSIPITCLKEDISYNIANERQITNFLDKTVTYGDIQILNLEFMTYFINSDPENEENRVQEKKCLVETDKPVVTEPKLRFSTNILQFGALPHGIKLTRPFGIYNNTKEKKLSWRLAEIKVDIDKKPSIGCIKKKNISATYGTFTKNENSFEILYKINAKAEEKWVSYLLLMSKIGENFKIEDICIVCFEVVSFDIHLHSANSTLPVLCSMDLDHIGVPVNHKIYIHNNSPLMSCFCFLQPFGIDKDAVEISFETFAGVVPSRQCRLIECVITPLKSGLFDEIYIPCFVAKNQPLLNLRVVIAVDNINIYFYLPENDGYYKKILWPPFSADATENYVCPCEDCLPECQECTNPCRDPGYIQVEVENEIVSETEHFNDNTNATTDNGDKSESQNDGPFEWIPFNSATESRTSIDDTSELIKNLKSAFGRDIMLHEYVVEVNNLSTKFLNKFTFYFENITPMKSKYSVESVNYTDTISLNNNLNKVLNKLKLRNPYEELELSCNENYGVVVIPETNYIDVLEYEIVQVNVWIYANTWGIYLEEIFVEIGDIVPFGFSLIIEVTGVPLEWPIALNAISNNVHIRLGAVISHSESTTRKLLVKNSSSIPLHLIWQTYQTESTLFNKKPFNVVLDLLEGSNEIDIMNLFISEEYYGKQAFPLLQIEPSEFVLEKQSSQVIQVTFRPVAKPILQQNYKFLLIGNTYISNEHKCKLNYFYRKTERELNPVKVNVSARVEMPHLNLIALDNDTIIDVHVNDLLFNCIELIERCISLRNESMADIYISAHITEPFKILYMETSNCKSINLNDLVYVKSGEVVQIKVQCSVSAQSLQEASAYLYSPNKTLDVQDSNCIDRQNKIITCDRTLNIHHKGLMNQAIPFQLILRYPRISLVPESLKFGYVLLQRTKKSIFTLYNYTDSPVKFEIYKSNNNYLFYVHPHYGEIPCTTGINPSFVNIAAYFTPIECKFYQESLRICTNILPYFIEMSITGYGINNEKFDTF